MKRKFYTCKYDRPFKIIFLNPKNKNLLKKLLETILKVEIKEIEYLNVEVSPDNIYTKGKRLDAFLETNEGQIGIEVNAIPKDYIHQRNMAFLCDRYANYVQVGNNYDEFVKIIQINLSYGIKDNKGIREYKLRDEDNKEFVKNFIIYEINMDYYKKIWENKNEEEIAKNKYLIMQDLDEEELKKWSKKDKEIREYMEKIEKLNENNKFREYMTYEEDQEKIHNSLRKEGANLEKIEIAKNLLKKNMSIQDIIEITGLSKEKIEELNENNKFREYITYEEDQEKIHNFLRQEGANLEKREIAKNLLKENISIDIISTTTGLSKEKIEELNKNNKFREYITYEEDQEKIHNSLRQEGANSRNIEIAKNLLKKNMSIQDIIEITGLSKEEIEKL